MMEPVKPHTGRSEPDVAASAPASLEEVCQLRLAERSREADAAALSAALELMRTGHAVPSELEERASWAMLRDQPDDADRVIRVCSLREVIGLAALPDLEAAAWARKLECDGLSPNDRAAVARRLVYLCATLGWAIDEACYATAFGADFDEGSLHGFIQELRTLASGARQEAILGAAVRLLPASEVALYFYAAVIFERGRAAEAEHVLSQRMALVERCDFLSDLYWKCLLCLGRDAEIESRVRAFFARYSGDWWRQPGFREAQSRSRDLPPILIVTQPKSGSVFTLNTLTQGLSAPWTYVCPLGLWPHDGFVIPERLKPFAEGGAICVEHLRPYPHLVAELKAAGLGRIVLNLRDVRQAALSWVHHLRSEAVASFGPLHRARSIQLAEKDAFEQAYIEALSFWCEFQESWLEFLKDPELDVLVTNFLDLKNGERGYFERILDFYEIPRTRFDWSVLESDRQKRAYHFRRGEVREWESVLSEEVRAQIPAIVAEWPAVSRMLAAEDAREGAARHERARV